MKRPSDRITNLTGCHAQLHNCIWELCFYIRASSQYRCSPDFPKVYFITDAMCFYRSRIEYDIFLIEKLHDHRFAQFMSKVRESWKINGYIRLCRWNLWTIKNCESRYMIIIFEIRCNSLQEDGVRAWSLDRLFVSCLEPRMRASYEKPPQWTTPQLETRSLQPNSKGSQENCAEIGQIFLSTSGGATDLRMETVKTCLPRSTLQKKFDWLERQN